MKEKTMKIKDTKKKSILCACTFAMLAGVPLLAEESPYSFTRGFPANDETIKQAQDATDGTVVRQDLETGRFRADEVTRSGVKGAQN